MRKVFFGYQPDFAERWVPVAFYDDVPTVNGKRRKFLQKTEFFAEGNVSLTNLQMLYPLTKSDEGLMQSIINDGG